MDKRSYFAQLFAMMAMPFQPYKGQDHARYSGAAFQQRERSIRHPKEPIKKAAIERRRKATKLSKLSKPKRRKIYYYNLRHPVKMYA
jgi:hypothetical protein